MIYSKRKVNEIIDHIITSINEDVARVNYSVDDDAVNLIREEHGLIDNRTTAIVTYASDIRWDFVTLRLTYKELMEKYHCADRTVRTLLVGMAEDDSELAIEIESRRRDDHPDL